MSEIAPIRSIEDFYREKNPFTSVPRRPIDSKIQGVVLTHIPKSSPSTLLASVTSPRIVIDLIPGIAIPAYAEEFQESQPKFERKPIKKTKESRRVPIGLKRCDLFAPLNSIMQLALFLPRFRDVLSFAPRSFDRLADFFDRYAADQDKNLLISTADPNALLRLLIQKLPAHFFRFQSAKIDVRDFLFTLMKAVFAKATPALPNSIIWTDSLPFSCAVDLPSRPSELLVTVKNRKESPVCTLIQRQFFTKPDSYCYDLDAFIEYRTDGKENHGDHIAYLKSHGTWYQCDDDRITSMRSTNLNMALNQSTLLHYRRIWPQ